ncbi:MAG: hypothetical protein FK734_00645 [Asgard group archaeon]|nr:hypothetical protein [Asgard group archaeon]
MQSEEKTFRTLSLFEHMQLELNLLKFSSLTISVGAFFLLIYYILLWISYYLPSTDLLELFLYGFISPLSSLPLTISFWFVLVTSFFFRKYHPNLSGYLLAGIIILLISSTFSFFSNILINMIDFFGDLTGNQISIILNTMNSVTYLFYALFLLLFSFAFHGMSNVKGFNTRLMISPIVLLPLILLKISFSYFWASPIYLYLFLIFSILSSLGFIASGIEWFINLLRIDARQYINSISI